MLSAQPITSLCKIVVSGDYMVTSTFNGSLESGVNAEETVVRFLALGGLAHTK